MNIILFLIKVIMMTFLGFCAALAVIGIMFVFVELKLIFSGVTAQAQDELHRAVYALQCLKTEQNIAHANHNAILELCWWYENGLITTDDMYELITRLEIRDWYN